jgi:hypothetical protein
MMPGTPYPFQPVSGTAHDIASMTRSIAGVLAVLDLVPIGRAAATIATGSALGHKPFEPHKAGMPEQVGTDFPLFKVAQKDAIKLAVRGAWPGWTSAL